MNISRGVSVIICCFNSAERIVDTIKYLAEQIVPKHIDWEVILVNNASVDSTVEIANKTWTTYNISTPLILVEQPIPGLSYAREKGIEVAKYEYLLFCDDDNWLDRNYIEETFGIMDENPKVAALGGFGIPTCENNYSPFWFKDYAGIYATGCQGSKDGILEKSYTLYGAGTTYRKSSLLALFDKGFKFYLSGRSKDKLTTGEDRELCFALSLNGEYLYYSSKLRFWHFIPEARLTEEYRDGLLMGAAKANYVLTGYQISIQNLIKNRAAYKSSWQWIILMRLIVGLQRLIKEIFHKKGEFFKYRWMKEDIVCFYKHRKEYTILLKSIERMFILKSPDQISTD